ncbi:MAG TPA: hypothetical protein EYH30_10705, partial [Anaerolineales bacterium]|nr:hypothetical protein [Anaerolineales bacterium]
MRKPRGPRNDVSTIPVPVDLVDFKCGPWGKHAPPRVENGRVVVEVGEGYRSSRHLHGQNIYVLDVDGMEALVEVRKYGDLYGAGRWKYLFGCYPNGEPYILQVKSTVETLEEARRSLIPASVQKRLEAGEPVIEYGIWLFLLARPPKSGPISTEHRLGVGYIAERAVVMKTVMYVSGCVAHYALPPLYLEGWHKAVRNKAIHHGFLRRQEELEADEKARAAMLAYRLAQVEEVRERFAAVLENLHRGVEELLALYKRLHGIEGEGIPESPETLEEILQALRKLAQPTRRHLCLECRYTWAAAEEAALCPRCGGRRVVCTAER